MSIDPLKSGHRRRTYTAQFKVDMVPQCLQGDVSLASLAVDHGMNPANWIPLSPTLGTAYRQLLARAPDKVIDALPPSADADLQARSTIALELAAQGLRMTLRWPVEDRRGLAGFVRELLT